LDAEDNILQNFGFVQDSLDFGSLKINLKICWTVEKAATLISKHALRWDFSWVDPTGTPDQIRRSLHDHINACIEHFCSRYREILKEPTPIEWENALVSIKHLLSAVQRTGHPLYLLIDEYDNFANEVLTMLRDQNDLYTALVHQNGPLKTLFKGLKSATGEGLIERMFITGVSPVVLSDITSGFTVVSG
jgi:hypothetical protein